ncbi:hypothetical protein MSAN_01171800 [Mycena sanguinolenta]|uniref:P-loop containing nucleoside triphosphate hydrolase protein n=1 Tax=Mycena sanguinolenta TaxID=230812 RepID=A0A8H7D411_9AGAR|nr:hypothetical protein MSAN_01171800 [Mycena sanguinolenta]
MWTSLAMLMVLVSLKTLNARRPTLSSKLPQINLDCFEFAVAALFSAFTTTTAVPLHSGNNLVGFDRGIAPFMTVVIGHAFDAFSKFSAPPKSSDDPRELLLHRVGISAMQLVGLAVSSFLLSSLTSWLWIMTGEVNVLELRKRVYASVSAKDMMWFDTRAFDASPHDEQGPLGAGGLMAQFTRETDEVRSASSLATGRTIEYLTTSITCLILAFSRSYSLTLVILSAVPILVIIQALSQTVAAPLLGIERQQTAVAATLVDRCATGISTVKAFNAGAHEQRALKTVLDRIETAFVMMGMFVQGFWFGARVVKSGHIGAGEVMAVFWACLMAATNLQLCIPQFILLSKGKFAFTSLLALVDAETGDEAPAQVPCHADILLQDISFAYPSRPAVPILRTVTLSFPASKTTFIVGSSGSGKSTIAHLLAGLYAPQCGAILVDDRATDPRVLDVAVVGQGQACALFDMSIHDNVALGRRPEGPPVTRGEVEAACRRVLMHEFISGLPGGYDTLLGRGGASLSGGQAQRLAIARVMLRDPDVLVLDEATSALDPISRISADDFVYVLKDGCVVETGYRAELDTYMCGVFGGMAASPAPIQPEHRPASPIVTEKTEDVLISRPLPFGHLSLPTLSLAPSAMTRVARVAHFTPNVSSFSPAALPTPYKPLPPPLTVFTRPPSLRFTPSDLVLEKQHETFSSDIKVNVAPPPSTAEGPPTLWALLREIYPTIPHKPLVLLGLVVCLLSGATTPVFSFLLSRLLFEVSTGAQNTHAINKYGAIVLAVAALDGLFMGLKYFLMQATGMAWVTRLRTTAFARVLRQDKRWFDGRTAGALGLVLIKDGDDARELLAGVAGQVLVVGAMFGVGLVWALCKGWQLAVVGFAVVPVFGAAMAAQAGVVERCQVRNKRAAEEVARRYYETISSIRGIRSMRFEAVFRSQFDKAADQAVSVARKGALVEGSTYGVACGLIYLAEAVLFYFGAVLVARGTYTYLQMVQVLNLVVFTVTIGSQLMAFTQRIAKSVQATRDFSELLRLPTRTDESDGFLRPRLDGAVTFRDVGFSYPERADVPVLQSINMQIQPGECVAIIGTSGSGKSTVAALLQRLYEPTFGSISIGLDNLRSMAVDHLRQHVSIVSQQPTLFDATIAENIAYGSTTLTDVDVRRAAEAANIHEFIMSLPQGYDTPVGENATLISGGQAQRLQIARALARPSKVLILDECTSALDDTNQAAVLDTIRHAKVGRTTIMITHKIPVMKMCDRLLVVHDGRIAEDGTYDELIRRQGVFAALVREEGSFAD